MFKSFKTKLASVKNDVTARALLLVLPVTSLASAGSGESLANQKPSSVLFAVERPSSLSFDSIYDVLLIKTVSSGISTKLNSVPTASESSEDLSPTHSIVSTDQFSSQSSESANLDTAQNLLHRYEETWEDLYTQSEANLKNAKALAGELHSTQHAMSIVNKKVGLFEAEVRELPAVMSSVQQLTSQIVELHSQCSLVEDALSVLENLCDRADVHLSKVREEEKLSAYKADKQKLLAVYSETLAAEHRKKLISLELREAEVRREKELFYQKAFEDDLKRFKAEQSLAVTQKSLEEVTIEPNRHEVMELEEFLTGSKANPLKKSDVSPVMLDNQLSTSTTQPDAETEEVDEIGPSHRTDSDSSLEWDYREDDLNISVAKQLESSLEMEINGILQNSRASLEPTSPDYAANGGEHLPVGGSS